MKNFVSQSYSHRSRRPQAEVSLDKSDSLFTVAFSWGEISAVEKANDTFTSYYLATVNDIEITSPFESLSALTPLANKMRTGLLIANNNVYTAFNSHAFAAGCEYLCVATDGRELVTGQVGGPSLILVRKNENILLSTTTDLYFAKTNPLPANLIGTSNECYPQVGSFRFEYGDQLFLIARSFLPSNILNLDLSGPLVGLTQMISQQNPNMPFWLGRMSL